MASRTDELEVGKDKDIESDDWSGKVTRKRMIYDELIKKVSQAQSELSDGDLGGALKMYDLVKGCYPKVELKYGKHKFSAVSDLYDSKEGQAFANGPLLNALIRPVSLSKN